MVASKNLLLSTATLWAAGSVSGVMSAYTLKDTYDTSNFFDEFTFFTGADPTNGFVTYVNQATADAEGLAGYSDGAVYMGVDYKNNSATTGRASVRVTSNKSYTKALFVADIAHMPAGASDSGSCGLWPAYWTVGPDWPNDGEIDIIEGVNTQATDQMTLHTSAGCDITNNGSLSGTTLVATNCEGNSGCGMTAAADNTFGADFNSAGGGVYAVEWTDSEILVWFFARGSAEVTQLASATSPDPSTFGTPLAAFGGCAFDTYFKDHQIVFDTTFCGDWAGEVWSSNSACSGLAATCQDWVGNNAAAFADAYWLVNYVKVFQ